MPKRTQAQLRDDAVTDESMIGEIARQVGLRASAVRYYENDGLLLDCRCSPAGALVRAIDPPSRQAYSMTVAARHHPLVSVFHICN